MTVSTIIAALEEFAPLSLQESWDNSGLQIGLADGDDGECTGVMLCLDVTTAVIAEAREHGCNLVVSHHPLIFKGLKHIAGRTIQERAAADAIRAGIAVYSSHTALDSAEGGVSCAMAEKIGARVLRPLAPTPGSPEQGLGVVAEFDTRLTMQILVERLHKAFDIASVKASRGYRPDAEVRTIALCGGSGGEFIADAKAAGAQAYVTADIRYHDFADLQESPLAVFDIGHFESERCAEDIIHNVINNKFPNFKVLRSVHEKCPVLYL